MSAVLARFRIRVGRRGFCFGAFMFGGGRVRVRYFVVGICCDSLRMVIGVREIGFFFFRRCFYILLFLWSG